MSMMVRSNPETACVRSHHPHRWFCADPGCGCDYLTGVQYTRLDCCVCGQEWPCSYRKERDAAAK